MALQSVPLSSDPSWRGKTCHVGEKKTFNSEKKKNIEETSGRATEEGSLLQDGQTCNRYIQNRTRKSQFIDIIDSESHKTGAAKWCPSHTRSGLPWWSRKGQDTQDNQHKIIRMSRYCDCKTEVSNDPWGGLMIQRGSQVSDGPTERSLMKKREKEEKARDREREIRRRSDLHSELEGNR